jgi:hypothetical protein
VLGAFTMAGHYTGWNVGTGGEVDFTYAGHTTPTEGAPPAGASDVELYTPASTDKATIGNHTPAGGVTPSWSQGYN